MPRSSWNPHSPDTIGVQFEGVGVANNVISTGNDIYTLEFTAQQSGSISSVAVYSGALTYNPLINTNINYLNMRRPWIVELIPVSGYDPGDFLFEYYTNLMTASSDVLDEVFTAPENNELNAYNDGLALFQAGPGIASATVQFDTTAFPTTGRHILAIGIEVNTNRQAYVDRVDQTGSVGWTRLFTSGFSTFHLPEAYREQGTSTYALWTPTFIRQFDNAVGNRRLRFRGIDTQPMLYDYLQIHVDYITERRAGVALITPAGPYEWTTGTLVIPNTTNPVPVTAGTDYVVVVRAPMGQNDYAAGNGARFDWRSLNDVKAGGITPVHYTHLDWDSYIPEKDGTIIGSEAIGQGTIIQGLPSFRMLTGTSETRDTQPYANNYSGVRPLKSSNIIQRSEHFFSIVSGTTRYRYLKTNVSLLFGGTLPVDKASVDVTINNSVGAVIAGPVSITEDVWRDSPKIGTDIWGDEYHQVTLDFGTSFDIDNVTASSVRFTLSDALQNDSDGTNRNPWRIGALVSEVIAATGSDQTAPSNASAQGLLYQYPAGGSVSLNSPGTLTGDLQVQLISEVPAITGASVTVLSQSVSGGLCDECNDQPSNCVITGITYNHICWSPTTLVQGTFSYYEIQRYEQAVSNAEWITVSVIAPTGAVVVTGAPVTGVATCYDDWTMVYDTPVCYRIRQRRVDGGLSDFVEEVCITTPSPTGADIVITDPLDPSLNVAFPEVYGSTLPIEKEWEVLDSDQRIFRSVYGRDKYVSFRPLETLGLRFKRRVAVTALCTPVKPCIQVMDRLREITESPDSLVVRDTCGNRWYAAVNLPTFTQIHDPDLGDLWLADIIVTELTTPVVTALNASEVVA